MKLSDGSRIGCCIVQRLRYEPEEGYYLVQLELIGHRLYLNLYPFPNYPKLPGRIFNKKINNRYLLKWLSMRRFCCEATFTFRDIKKFSFDNKSITKILHTIRYPNLSLSEVLDIYITDYEKIVVGN